MSSVKVKICGITNIDDALCAVDAGADLLGFIFYPKSPRYVAPQKASEIVATVRNKQQADSHPSFVGVFVNTPLKDVQAIQQQAALSYVQLHGDEAPEMVQDLAHCAFKALRPANNAEAQADAARFAHLATHAGPTFLVDAYDTNVYGGTGKKADWTVAAQLARQYPRVLLAGGLTPDNVAHAIKTVQPWGVDLSSGVEARPGYKNHEAVKQLIVNAKSA